MSLIQRLYNRGLLNCPSYVGGSTQYEVLMGSIAYGVDSDSSDNDVYGFCIPPKDIVFPHLSGEIFGFGRQIKRFEQYQEHHVKLPDFGKEYDFDIYNIVKYFQLCMECNPNMIDSLFVPQRCVLHSTLIGNHVRENRRAFLSKAAWPRFKGYSYQQLNKIENKSYQKFYSFAKEHGLSTAISIDDVRQEIQRRNLKI